MSSFFLLISTLTNFRCREEALDELDYEILNIGYDTRDLPSRSSSSRPKYRSSSTQNRLLHDYYSDSENANAENDGSEEEEPVRKKQRKSEPEKPETETAALQPKIHQASKEARRSVQKVKSGKPEKKKPRRMPVNELVTISERFDSPDMESDDGKDPFHHVFKFYERRSPIYHVYSFSRYLCAYILTQKSRGCLISC